MKIFVTMFIALLSSSAIFCQQQEAVPSEQAKIVFNGAYIVMHNRADLVIENTSPKALTVKNGGGIISEDANNNVKWNIKNDSGYTVPFISEDLKSIPVSFNTSNGTGAGSFTLSTYSGSPDWKNSDYLPTGVTNVNRNGKDNSNHLIDRFWKISPAGYTTNPNLKNLSFAYKEVEWNESSNVITEKNLVAQNWNGTKWLASVGKDNPSLNFVKITSANNFFPWWVLADSNFTLNNAGANFMSAESADQQKINSFISLGQNFLNPFYGITIINYSLPKQFVSARIIVTNKNGNVLKQINLSNNKGSITIDAATLISGAYQYSLYVDGKLIATKQMELIK